MKDEKKKGRGEKERKKQGHESNHQLYKTIGKKKQNKTDYLPRENSKKKKD